MFLFLFMYSIFCISLDTILICLSRTLFKNTKAGMSIYLFSNISNLIIAYFLTPKKKYFNKYILLITGGFNFSTICYFLSIYMNMSSVKFNNYYSIKILLVSILSMIFLKAKYGPLQYLGKILIGLGILLQFNSDKDLYFNFSILTAILSGTFNALSTVLFEYKVKDTLISMYEYIFTFNVLYLPFNIIFASIECYFYESYKIFFKWFFYILIILNVISLQLSVFLSLKVDSFERTIISVLCNMMAGMFSDVFLDLKFDIKTFLSLIFITVGTILYITYKKINNENKDKI